MHRDVHRYLDGELPRSALNAAAAAELAEWESLQAEIALRRGEHAPAWLESAVMREIEAADMVRQTTSAAATSPAHAAQEPLLKRAWGWLMTPRPIAMPPFAPIAAAALVVLLLARGGSEDAPVVQQTTNPFANAEPMPASVQSVVYVQFALDAQGARSVSVAGDFNDWSADLSTLRDPDGDGVWTGLVPVRPGVHKYMFVVDGEEWVTDPRADSYVDDGFGMRNALLAVAAPEVTL